MRLTDFSDWVHSIQVEIPKWEDELIEEAKTEGTYQKGLNWLKSIEPDFPSTYGASPEEYVAQLTRIIPEEAYRKLLQEAKDQPVKEK